MVRKICVYIFLLLTVPVLSHAASVNAQVDRNQLTIDDTLTLTVSVTDSDADVDTSVIKDFKILSQSSGSNYQWINGKSSSEYTHSYTLAPLKKGNLVIPRLAVKDKGNFIYTDRIIVSVDDSPAGRPVDKTNSDLFVKAHVNDTSPYVGQQILYTFYLYTAVQVNNPSLNTPDFKGFTIKETEKDNNYTSIINGREYNVVERHIWLQPLKAGVIEIPPSILNCNAVSQERTRKRDPFGGFFDDPFFGGRTQLVRKVLRTQPVTVEVRTLPKNPYDVPFSGLIGKMTMSVKVDSRDLKVGDSSTLTYAIDGTGNLMDASAPALTVPEGLKTYKDNPEDAIKLGKQGYSGKKTYKIALVPVKEGLYTIPSIKLNYFDIERGAYQILASQPIELKVSPGQIGPGNPLVSSGSSDMQNAIVKKKVEYTGHDILPLKESLDGIKHSIELSVRQYSLILLVIMMFLGVAKGVYAYSGRTRSMASLMDDRADAAIRTAAQKGITDEEFLAQIYKAFVSKIYSRSDISGETLTISEIRQILNKAGYEIDCISESESLLNEIESIRFGGGTLDAGKRDTLLEKTRKLLRRLK